jgi:hypothetical protein
MGLPDFKRAAFLVSTSKECNSAPPGPAGGEADDDPLGLVEGAAMSTTGGEADGDKLRLV